MKIKGILMSVTIAAALAVALGMAISTFRPGNTSDKPPQEHDAKCGVECHDGAKNRDYVWTQCMPK